ncbi:valine--tRNA ligase [Lawsonia intracellularis]|uniref:valine--tRNA ligase n=1 Tax=Lawsonia intracellularis TaxID=29546 RepID=UPI000975D166|nr:valine--tRNA ligase [Lawsonia intracellularis]OMQ04345.1 valine--tRNA ligase [Lawsonia intracellularis]
MTDVTLPKAYEPKDIETYWRDHWERNNTFTPNLNEKGEPFCIVIPPPNVTGILHIGHALNITLQDILCRHARQQGKKVLWIPGTDHAGIATQHVVERMLAKENVSREQLGREAFIQKVWQWREKYGTHILEQLRRIGASVDWTRERFTMDDGLSQAVRKVFVELYKQGYIYKGKYIVNWCTYCHTALSDDEVEHRTEKGNLYYVRYKLEDGSDDLIIATTRPETIVADTGICINPKDKRYTHFIGKKAIVPIMNRVIPIIADNYVDQNFGTGVLKVTPCHDVNDWMLGHRHNLAFIQAINDKGIMTDEAGPYTGLSKEACRKQIVEDLQKQDLLIKIEDIEHTVGYCYRSHTVIEPYVSEQWFVAATKMAPQARAAVPEQTKLFPKSWLKTYYNWLDNIRDWCISRQIWWGHRIPAWTCTSCNKLFVEETEPSSCPCGSHKFIQETDVLDTWFSSAIWPFSTLGWPNKTPELAMFYPTSILVTGFDILFFWVARMMMFGLHFMKDVPFRHVYIHALIRDSEGRKMSKSLGNSIDPIQMIEKYGTDALRFTLTIFAAMGRDIRLSEERIEGYRHFMNKLWNASRFALMNLPKDSVQLVSIEEITALHHKWFLHRLEEVKIDVNDSIKNYRFNDMAQTLYKFFWNEFCDWYLEIIKIDFKKEGLHKIQAQYVLWLGLKELLILLHPIIPFITSEIWKALPGYTQELACELFPLTRPHCLSSNEANQMIFLQEVISAIRTIRAELNISPSYKLSVLLRPIDAPQLSLLQENSNLIITLAKLETLTIDSNQKAPSLSANHIIQRCEVIVFLSGAIDFNAEYKRLTKELNKVDIELQKITERLKNKNFIKNAPKEIVQKEQSRKDELLSSHQKIYVLMEQYLNNMDK